MWALDLIGPLESTVENTNRHAFVLTATEYFRKWAEAESFVHVKASTLVRFIKKNIITRFGVPKMLVTDNGLQFVSGELQ